VGKILRNNRSWRGRGGLPRGGGGRGGRGGRQTIYDTRWREEKKKLVPKNSDAGSKILTNGAELIEDSYTPVCINKNSGHKKGQNIEGGAREGEIRPLQWGKWGLTIQPSGLERLVLGRNTKEGKETARGGSGIRKRGGGGMYRYLDRPKRTLAKINRRTRNPGGAREQITGQVLQIRTSEDANT